MFPRLIKRLPFPDGYDTTQCLVVFPVVIKSGKLVCTRTCNRLPALVRSVRVASTLITPLITAVYDGVCTMTRYWSGDAGTGAIGERQFRGCHLWMRDYRSVNCIDNTIKSRQRADWQNVDTRTVD